MKGDVDSGEEFVWLIKRSGASECGGRSELYPVHQVNTYSGVWITIQQEVQTERSDWTKGIT